MAKSKIDKTLDLVRRAGVLRPRDLAAHGIARQYLRVLLARGLVERVGRGLYMVHDAEITREHSLAEVCKRVPHGVVCLLSALQFHEMTLELPFEVWLAVDRKARLPKEPRLPLRIVRFSGPALTSCVQEHDIEGVPVRIYSPAKTVADCFKYRNKIGLDVAMEALRDCWKKRLATMDEVWEAAKICHVNNVMRPYMEMLVP